MKQAFKKSIKLFIFIGLAVILLYAAFKKVDFAHLLDGLKNADYSWVVFAIIASILGYLLRAARWNILIEPLGFNPSLKNTFHAVAVGYFANLPVPRLGEVARCAALGKSEKIPFNSLIGTVIIERAIDLLSLIIITVIVFFTNINMFGNFINEHILSGLGSKVQSLSGIGFILIIIATTIITSIILLRIFHKKLIQIKFYSKIYNFMKGIFEGLKTIFQLKKAGLFFIYTLLMWGCYFLMVYLIFFSIPETFNLTMLDGLFVLIAGSFGMTVPAPGGMGAYHLFVAKALLLYNIEYDSGITYATLTHESQTIMIIVVGIISASILYFRNKSLFSKD